jgi:hypothetical protein
MRPFSLSAVALAVSITRFAAAQTAPTAPAARFHFSGTYDETRKEFVIYGGYIWDQATSTTKSASDVWGWNGTTWEQIASTSIHRYVAPMAFDSKRGRLVMFGGFDDADDVGDGRLSRLTAGTWESIKDLPALQRGDASLAYDSKRDRLVLFGGRNGSVLFADTWEFDGNDWKPTFMPGPSLRSSGAVAYDIARGVTVLYGGFRPLAGLGDTWEWNGEQWEVRCRFRPGATGLAWAGV